MRSAWKGYETTVEYVLTVEPSVSAASLSSGYRIGHVNGSYINYDKDEEQFVVWVVCGISCFLTQISDSTCYFKVKPPYKPQ